MTTFREALMQRRRLVVTVAVAVVVVLAGGLTNLALGLTAGASFPLTSDPTALMAEDSNGSNTWKVINLLARGADGNIWLLRRRHGVWDNWRSTGIGGPTEGVGAAQGASNHWVRLFVRNGTQLAEWNYQSLDLQKRQEQVFDSVRGSRAMVLKHSEVSPWMDVVARGENNSIWLRRLGGDGRWKDWQNLGGDKRDAPVAVEFPGSPQPRTAVFARGSDNALWFLRSTSDYAVLQGWEDWTKLGGTLNSGPGAVYTPDGLIHVFYRGTDNHLWHMWGLPTANQWNTLQDLGGTVASAPAVVSSAPGHIDVFVTGSDHQAWGRRWNGSSWSPWFRVGEDPTLPVLTVIAPDHGDDQIYAVSHTDSSRPHINCSLSANASLPNYPCAMGVELGTSVTLRLGNFDGRFKGWAGQCAHAGSNRDCTVVMNGYKTVSVTYN